MVFVFLLFPGRNVISVFELIKVFLSVYVYNDNNNFVETISRSVSPFSRRHMISYKSVEVRFTFPAIAKDAK